MLTLPDVDVEQWRRFHVAGDHHAVGSEAETFKRWERVRTLSQRGPTMQAGRIDLAGLRERQHSVAPILHRARDVLSAAIDELANRGLTVVLANDEGIILASWGSDRLLEPRYRGEFAVGARWDEATRGTNGIGTALVERRPVAVVGHSHYLEAAHGLCCYAAPIENPRDGSVMILDVTGSASSADPLLGVLTESLAATLEAALHVETGSSQPVLDTSTLEARVIADEDRLLSDASVVLGSSLDLDETLDAIMRLALDWLADWCLIDIVEADGGLWRARVGTRFADKKAISDAMSRQHVQNRRPSIQLEAIDQRQPIILGTVTDQLVDMMARNPAHRELMYEVAPRSAIALPLLAGERVLGALLLLSATPGLRYEARHARLAQSLAQRAALAIANARLHRVAQDAADTRADVLAIVAHDLRGPLTTIGVSSELLQERLADSDDRSVRAIVRSTQRMSRMVQDLLDASQSTTDRLSLITMPTPARWLLDDAVEVVRTLAGDRPLAVECADDLPDVNADRERVLQVVTNLVGNAVKFTPTGSPLVLSARVEGETVRFGVRDAGPGLTREQLEHVFERFWKGQRSDRRGVGLGLFISKQIVESHGGEIGAESTPGAGATFYFTLPISRSS